MTKIRYSLLGHCLISLLLISPTCVQVSDSGNRQEEINNAGQSLGEHVLWKKIEKTKEIIDDAYHKIHTLQDSIEQAKYKVKSITDMGMASIEKELLELNDLKMDVDAYVAGVPDNLYGVRLKKLYQRPDVAEAARELADMFYFTAQLPKETEQLEKLIGGNNSFRMYYQEFADKRATQAAQIYRKWAKLYRNKGIELSQKVLKDKAFTMTDFERINTQHMAQRYLVMSYEFTEKSDSILLAVTTYKDAIRSVMENQAGQYLFTRKLFE